MKRQIEAHGKKLEIMHSQHEEVMLAACQFSTLIISLFCLFFLSFG
jgi:hypothetical protein